MDIDEPAKVPGATLAAERDTYGVTRNQLAKKLSLHRNTIRGWETASELDVIRQHRYRRALRELVAEATGQAVAL